MSHPRYRCTACGNLTRFDVVVSRRTRAFHHYSVGGDLSVEEEEVLDQSIEDVSCRWCGHGRNVEEIEDPDIAEESEGSRDDAGFASGRLAASGGAPGPGMGMGDVRAP